MGGVSVKTGDIVVGDRDGVVVIGRDRWADALAEARARDAREVSVQEGLKAGKTTVELMKLDDALRQAGLT